MIATARPGAAGLLAPGLLANGLLAAGLLATGLLLSAPASAQCPGTDDAFEDNDTCAAPWLLSAGAYPGLYCEKEALDPDYFQVSVPSNYRIKASTSFAHAQADVDMVLFDLGCVSQLDSSGSSTDGEDVAWVNGTGATVEVVVLVYVYVSDPNDCNIYDLDLTVAPDPCLTANDDGFEDNDDCASAVSGVLGLFPGLFVAKSDYDYYAYTLLDGDTIDVDALFTHADGDVDIILYDVGTCGGGLGSGLEQGSSVDDDETLSYTNLSGAPMDVVLEINVWANSDFDCNDYDLNVVVSGGPGPIGSNYCGPANLNSSGQAAVLSAFGLTQAAANDVRLDGAQLALNQFGMFLNSTSQGFVLPPGSQGNLCLSGAIGRYNGDIMNTGGGGAMSLQLDLGNTPTPGGPVAIQAGETWNFQLWFRDQNPGATSNFTDGITISFN